MDEWVWSSGGKLQQEITEVPRNKHVLLFLYSLQFPYGLAEERDRATAVRGRWLSTWAVASTMWDLWRTRSVSGKGIPPNTWVIFFLVIICLVFRIDWFVMLGMNSGLITGHILSMWSNSRPILQIVPPILWFPSVRIRCQLTDLSWFKHVFSRYGKCRLYRSN